MEFWKLLRDGLGGRGVGLLEIGKASGGSTTTIVDSNIPNGLSNDTYAGGTAIILRDSDGAAAAPEGEFSRITSFNPSTKTFTTDDTLTAAVASGDRYGVLPNDLGGHENVIDMASGAIQDLGDIVNIDTTTLDTASNQSEYAWAAAWKRKPPIRVDIQTNTADANDNRWMQTHAWEAVPAAAGSAGLIIFYGQPTASRDIRVWYLGPHTALNAYSDVISEHIHPALAKAAFVEAIRNWQLSDDGFTDQDARQAYNKASSDLEEMMLKHKIWKPQRQPKLGVTLSDSDDFTAGKVKLV